MGDFADDLMFDAIDGMAHGNYRYTEVDDSDPRMDDEFNEYSTSNISIKNKVGHDDIFDDSIYTHTSLEFKEILRETDKSWILKMSGDAVHHFSMKYCELNNNEVIVPKWLLRKMWYP